METDGAAAFAVTAKCFDGRSIPLTISPAETIGDVKLRLQRMTGMHAATQRMLFSGVTLKDDERVSTTALCDGASVFVLLTKAFPATLGPFETQAVPFTASDFELPPLDSDFAQHGTMWLMQKRAVTRHGVRTAAGTEFPIAGQFSPPHPITLTATEKAAIGIVQSATSFVWSYPVVSWSALNGGSDAARSFLGVGGYVYLDDAHRIVAATTLTPSTLEAGGLQFGRYKTWKAEWTAALMKQGRFQRITIQALNELGAHHFCWLRPGEIVHEADGRPCATQPSVPHGGFAYLFHDDVLCADAERLVLDRYFPCASGDDYVEANEEDEDAAGLASARERRATFALVSELHARDAAPTTAGASGLGGGDDAGDAGVMRATIDRLERQLDSVTKCVVCLVEDKDTCLMDCNHLCMCSSCASRVTRCPICRRAVRDRRRVFQG